MAGPPLRDGGVLVDGGRIAAVGDRAALRRDAGREHHVTGVLLPGLVNGSTRLEHTDAAALARPGPWQAWRRAVDGLTGQWSEERWGRSAHRGVLSAIRSGTTLLCDVVTRGPAVPAASRAGLAGDSFVEVTGVDAEHADEVLAQVEHALGLPAAGRRVGIAMAPTMVGTGVFQSLAVLADRRGAPLQVLAAETNAEALALRNGEGPIAVAAREAGMAFEWLGGGAPTPVRYAEALGALRERSSVAPGTWIDDGEARLLARLGVAVVCTTRGSQQLGAGAPPLERFADAGTPLALGTGSPAASGDFDVLAEAGAWARLAREAGLLVWPSTAGPVSIAEAAIRLATVDGARALGWGGVAGVLEAGRRADLTAVELETTPEAVFGDLVDRGAGRQVLTVVEGVRKARRRSAEDAWPPLDDDSWRAA